MTSRTRLVALLVAVLSTGAGSASFLGRTTDARAADPVQGQVHGAVPGAPSGGPNSGPNPNDPSTGALAGPTTTTGSLEITTLYGQPLELEPHGNGFVGQFALRNAGAKPLTLKELQFRATTEAADQETDPALAVKAGSGSAGPIKLAPGETRKVSVVWTPSKLARLKQLYAQVLVQPDDSPAPLQAINVHAARESAFPLVTDHPLGWLILLPLLGALVTALLGLRGGASRASDAPVDPRIRLAGLGVTFAQLLVALYALATFDPTLTRAVGNDGLQMVDRVLVSRGAGLELSLGVDGLGVVLVALVALASFLSIVVMPGADETRLPTRAESRTVPLVLLVSASAMAFFTVGDAVFLVIFGALLLVNAVRLIGAEPTRAAQVVARRLGSAWIFGLVLLAVAVMMLRAHSSAIFLVDGSRAEHVSSIGELARQVLVARGGLPQSAVKECYLLLLAAAVLLSPLTPAGGGLLAAVTPRPASEPSFAGGAIPLVLSGALAPAGMYVMLRVVAPILPEAVRWGGPATATLGAILFAAGAVAAWVTPSLERRAALLVGAQSGAALLGIGALTQEGIASAYLLTVAPAIALLFLNGFGLRGSRAGQLAFAIGVVFAGALVGPGAWGALLAATGSFASSPAASVIGWIGFALGAGVGLFGVCRAVVGRAHVAARWTSAELGAGAAVLVIAALLTMWPAGLMAPFAGVLRDSVDRLDPPGPDQIASR